MLGAEADALGAVAGEAREPEHLIGHPRSRDRRYKGRNGYTLQGNPNIIISEAGSDKRERESQRASA